MKIKGFTLAELMSTLAIIGLLATLTVPIIANNIEKHRQRTLLRKGIQTLNEAITINISKGKGDLYTYTDRIGTIPGIPEYLAQGIDTATGVKKLSSKNDDGYKSNSLYIETKDGIKYIFPIIAECQKAGDHFFGISNKEHPCPVMIDTHKAAKKFDYLPPLVSKCSNLPAEREALAIGNSKNECANENELNGVFMVLLTNDNVYVPYITRKFLGDAREP